jgi:hypothetical protein
MEGNKGWQFLTQPANPTRTRHENSEFEFGIIGIGS